MAATYETELYRRVRDEIDSVAIIDCHEHLQRERELPEGDDIHIGRFFAHYASSDLVSAGMPPQDLARVQTDSKLSPVERWRLIGPWWRKAWNTGYCQAVRVAIRDLYGDRVETLLSTEVDFSDGTMREIGRASCRERVLS